MPVFRLFRWFCCFLLFVGTLPATAHEHEGAYQFVENKGQWEKPVIFRSDVPSGALFLERQGLTYRFYDAGVLASLHGKEYDGDLSKLKMRYHTLRIGFVGANPNTRVQGHDAFGHFYNYFLGNDQSKWVGKAKAYPEITYQALYPGINLELYTHQQQLKYDFKVAAGANPHQIKLRYRGAERLKIKDGRLIVRTSLNELIEEAPYAYQRIDGKEIAVPCSFALEGEEVKFVFPEGYREDLPLVIDPTLIFSTFSGSAANNFGYTATFDNLGFLYTGSTAFGVGYDTTAGAYSTTFAGGNVDIALTKFDTTGSALIWSTYIGGDNDELPHSLVVNRNHELYLMGTTSSSNFPMTDSAFSNSFGGGTPVNLLQGLGVNFAFGSDLIIARLSANGATLLSSTFLGGPENDGLNTDPNLRYNYADEVRGEILLDAQENILIASSTQGSGFPTGGNPMQAAYGGGDQDGTLTKLNPNLSQVFWSTFVGGDQSDALYSIALDNLGDIYVCGGTFSFNLPSTSPLFPTFTGGTSDGLIAKISGNGQTLQALSYFGTPFYEQLFFIETDRENKVYVFGQTESQDSSLFFNANYGVPGTGQVVSKFSSNLDTLVWSTNFGTTLGSPNLSPTAFLVDVCNSIYLSGWGGTVNQLGFLNNNTGNVNGMDTTSDAFQGSPGDPSGSDFYFMVLSDDANSLIYASFFGGTPAEHVDGGTSRFDRKGRIYQSVCAGCGGSSSFPLSNNPYSATNGNQCNNAVVKLDFNLPIVVADFFIPPQACRDYTVNFVNSSLEQGSTQYFWDFGDMTTSTLKNPTHVYTATGTYTVTLAVSDFASCNLADTLRQQVVVVEDTSYTLTPQTICSGDSASLGISPEVGHNYQWNFGAFLNNPNQSNPMASPNSNTTFVLLDDDGVCVDTVTQAVSVVSLSANAGNDTLICSTSNTITLVGSSNGTATSYHWSSNSSFTDTLNNFPTGTTATVSPTVVTTVYYLKTTRPPGCEQVDSVSVTISDYAVEVEPFLAICAGDSNLVITAVNLAPGNPLTYSWTPTSSILTDPSQAQITVNPVVSTSYVLTTTNSSGCVGTNTVFVGVSAFKDSLIRVYQDDDTIGVGNSTTLHVRPLGMTYQWQPAASLNDPTSSDPIATPTVSTNYTVTVSDPSIDLSCEVELSLRVEVIDFNCGEPDVFVPNAFSPNSDQANDVLLVRGNRISSLYFAVYNRWGEVVFETRDQSVGWDGSYKGKPVDPAVYAYYLEVTCPGEATYFKKGNVSVIR